MSSVSDLAIRTRGLRKVFNSKVAVRSLTLEVSRGEVFGFLGPNGAGKSTSVKMLLGLVFPTNGQAEILGRPAGDVKTRTKVGFLPEHFRFYDWLNSAELLSLHGRLYGMSHAALRQRIPFLLEVVGLTPHREKQLRNFSKGMLQRIGLAQALLNEPDLIFLDEPTSGLDPIGRRLVRDIIKAERARGATVLLNSHLLGEVEITCDRVAFIKDGEVLETRHLRDEIEGQISVSIRAANLTAEIVNGLSQWTTEFRSEGERLILSLSSSSLLPEIVRYLVAKGADVYEVTPQRVSLEERFLQIVGSDGGL
ncbi:MAG TPA: ABC transporter ATP-binding protein [Terriglobales bacterium]|jgi:ABC-2 type transport system ATP-binding protein|nr:ABC transporter ATP-binding protein [Terriglobales bacterium]